MKPAQYFTLAIGIIYTILGIAGLLPNVLGTAEATQLTVDPDIQVNFSYLLGFLPVNNLISSINLIIGLAGVLAALALDSSRFFSGLLGIIMALGAILGLIPFANTLFGLTPLFGANVILHALTAAAAVYFGFVRTPDLLEISDSKA